MGRISAQIVRDQLEAIAGWSMPRADAEVHGFMSRQPVVNAYVLATVEDAGREAVGFALHMALAIDTVYAAVVERAPRRITARIMDWAAGKTEKGFAQLVGVEPEFALRRMLFQRDLAEPELVVELMRVLMEESVNEPDLERALGVVFLAIKTVALAYERGNGLASGAETKGSLAQVLETRLGRPLPKIGRNEPCPCGSGRKFKQCCAGLEPPPTCGGHTSATRLGDGPTERLFRAYRDLVKGTVSYCGVVEQTDGAWLDEQRRELERRYHPGRPGGVPEPLICTYLLYDLELPSAGKTVGQLMLEREGHTLGEPGPMLLRHLCESYVAFYELVARNPEAGTKTLRELGTDAVWTVGDIEDPSTVSGEPGELWLCRLVGPPSRGITLMAPLIYPRQASACLETFVRLVSQDDLARGLSRADALRASMKRGLPLLAEYLIFSDDDPEPGPGKP